MIKADKGGVEYKGTTVELLSEMTMCLRALRDDEIINDKDLDFMMTLVKTPREKLFEDSALKVLTAMVATMGEDAVREFVRGEEEK